jgi:hypothetical protein
VSLGDAPEAVLMRGGSAIINPLGKVLAGPHFAGETILTADLDLHDIGRGKFDFDVTGHYCRPDIFQLIVHEAPMPAVVTKTGACVSIGSVQFDNSCRVGLDCTSWRGYVRTGAASSRRWGMPAPWGAPGKRFSGCLGGSDDTAVELRYDAARIRCSQDTPDCTQATRT